MREIAADQAAIQTGPRVRVPSETGTFDDGTGVAPPATRKAIMVVWPAAELRTSQMASRVLHAAEALAARPADQAKNGLGVQV
jgi:hypothetical protein